MINKDNIIQSSEINPFTIHNTKDYMGTPWKNLTENMWNVTIKIVSLGGPVGTEHLQNIILKKKKTTTNKHQPPYNRDWYYKQGMGIPNGGYWLGKDPTETVTYFMKFLKFIFRNWFQARLLIQCSSVAQTVFIWELTHTPLHKMAVISQTIYSNAFSRMKNFVFWFKCHWSLFLRV